MIEGTGMVRDENGLGQNAQDLDPPEENLGGGLADKRIFGRSRYQIIFTRSERSVSELKTLGGSHVLLHAATHFYPRGTLSETLVKTQKILT